MFLEGEEFSASAELFDTKEMNFLILSNLTHDLHFFALI